MYSRIFHWFLNKTSWHHSPLAPAPFSVLFFPSILLWRVAILFPQTIPTRFPISTFDFLVKITVTCWFPNTGSHLCPHVTGSLNTIGTFSVPFWDIPLIYYSFYLMCLDSSSPYSWPLNFCIPQGLIPGSLHLDLDSLHRWCPPGPWVWILLIC